MTGGPHILHSGRVPMDRGAGACGGMGFAGSVPEASPEARASGIGTFCVGLLAPTGRRDVATGGAQARRAERNPWTGADNARTAPAGPRKITMRGRTSFLHVLLCPSGAGEKTDLGFHGFRDAANPRRCAWGRIAPPVATALGPSGVADAARPTGICGSARAIVIRSSAGEAPQGRHAPLAPADQHAASGRRGRHGA